MSTMITYPAFSERVTETISKYHALQHLRDNKRAMFEALLNKVVGVANYEDIDTMDKWADALNSVFISIDSTINLLGYNYNFGTQQNPITISTIFSNIISNHNKVFSDKEVAIENIQYTSSMFMDNNDIIYAPSGTANANMSSCFSGCRALVSIGDIDFTATTNMQYCFQNCVSLYIDKITFGSGHTLNIRWAAMNAYWIDFNDVYLTDTAGGGIGNAVKITGLDMSRVNDCGGCFNTTKLQELHVTDGAYFRYRQSLRGGSGNTNSSSRGGSSAFYYNIPNQVKAELMSHLYDWIHNSELDNLEDLTLVQQDYPFTRVLDFTSEGKASYIAYCIENELFGCATSDDSMNAETKIGNYLTGRGWSWS